MAPLATAVHSFFKWAIPGIFFFIFVFSGKRLTDKYAQNIAMSGFEPRISGVGSDHSANYATTTAIAVHSLQTVPLTRSV